VDFEEIKTEFVQFNTDVIKLRSQISSYLVSARSLVDTTYRVSQEHYNLYSSFSSGSSPSEYDHIMDQMKCAHENTPERTQIELLQRFEDHYDHRCANLSEIHKQLNTRIEARYSLLQEVDYYNNKVNGIRAKQLKDANSNPLNDKDKDRLTRNIRKLERYKADYTALNDALTKDLKEEQLNMHAIIGPLAVSFLNCEYKYATNFYDMMKGMNIPADLEEGQYPAIGMHSLSLPSITAQGRRTNPLDNVKAAATDQSSYNDKDGEVKLGESMNDAKKIVIQPIKP